MKPTRTLIVLSMLLVAGALALRRTPVRATSAEADAAEPAAVFIDAAKYPHLQAAFDAVPERGGLVRIPPGDFVLSEPLVLTRAETRVEGAGAATHLINRNEEGRPALVVRPPDWKANPKAKIWRVQLADFRISGNPASGDGLLAQGVNEIYVHGLSVDHNGACGINLVDCLEDPRVADSIITYNGAAGLTLLRNHDVVVNANQFEENQDAVRCIDCCNLCMNGNNVDDHLRYGVVVEKTYGSVISGNMIEQCKAAAVVLDQDCHGIAISANVIAHNYALGVDLRDAWGCTVSANSFAVVEQRALVVGPASGRITITGNNFANSFIGDGRQRFKNDAPASGILLDATSDVAVSGNVFTGLAGRAVEVQGPCRRLLIADNVMADLNRQTEQKLPALTPEGTEGSIVRDNVIQADG